MRLEPPFAPGRARRPAALGLAALIAALAAPACDNQPNEPEERARVAGVVTDVQAGTRLFFYDDELVQLGQFSVAVRQDGSYGPLSFPTGTFFGAGTASGFTSGQFVTIQVGSPDDSLTVNFDLDPLTIPLAVGNRWVYEERSGSSTTPRTVTVEITGSQPGVDVAAVFTVLERTADAGGGPLETTYFLAQDGQGIRKSADATIDGSDELLLRLPAVLGTSWSTVDLGSGAAVTKRVRALSCDDSGCVETNDFTIAQEPAGVFMSVSVIYETVDRTFLTVVSDVGIVDEVVQVRGSGDLISQRKLVSFTAGGGA